MNPQRVQLKRTKGWRKPENTVVVARPSKWGNPYRTPPLTPERAVAVFRRNVTACLERPWAEPHALDIRIITESLGELRGKDLACWCPLDQPCHADVLLELANDPINASAKEAS